MGFFKNIMNSITKASRPIFVFESQSLKFNIDSDEYFTFPISDYEVKTRHDPFVVEGYTLQNSDIFLEFIRLHNDSTWNGSSRSMYESFFKDELKLKSLEVLKREDFDHLELTTYKVNDSFIMHMIFIWDVSRDIFIIDTKGELFTQLMHKFKDSYEYPYIDEEKGDINFNISIVKKNNLLQQYFGSSLG